jgi:formylglycine-generating enzyme required for sulfatase activity
MRPLLAIAVLLATFPAAALDLELVRVGHAGNPADDTGRGAVPYEYWIGRTEVTNEQYVEFLNAVANVTDPNGLYNASMEGNGIVFPPAPMGFLRFYEVEPGFADLPVRFVSFWDAARFANWLHHGQPVGLQGPTTTEDGAYTLTPQEVEANTVARNVSALYLLPTENEWYKAAYYVPALAGYHDYPAGSDAEITCSAPTPAANRANCQGAAGGIVEVGSYPGSPSSFGTFDQGGNLREWVERISGAARYARGGYWESDPSELASTGFTGYDASFELTTVGFRIVSTVPESGAALVGAASAVTLAFLDRRRARRLRPLASGAHR